ncbi:hypothetical protein HMPREF9466_03061 [Fusobacterium necrophorum subsp. funduliforme 1_1_36S]|nr:hypothetical protein HMPREF9466_03061 [Fusobacterium necrophorum subsp. funduliforme 1_1_36S]
MKHNLEKDLKRWLKRKVSISLATIVVFAITGSVGLAENLTENYDDNFLIIIGQLSKQMPMLN